MRVLLTGSRGFVGRHLVARLAERGLTPIPTDLPEVDTSDPEALAAAVARERPDALVHLAGLSSVAQASRDPHAAFRVNFGGARSLLDAVARFAPRARVLLVGSGEVYGLLAPDEPPFRECAALRPASAYARSKAAADLLGRSYAARGLDVLRVRPFTHTGPGQSDAFALPSFARQLAEIEKGMLDPVLEVGNLDSIRDFLSVDDVAAAYLALLDPRVPAAAYNVASGTGHRIGALLERLIAIMGVRARISVDPARLRPADRSVGDASRLRAATGWAPRVSIDALLSSLAEDGRRRASAA